MRWRTAAIALPLVILAACGTTAPTAGKPAATVVQHASASASASAVASPSASPTVIDAAYVAKELATVEQAIRWTNTPESEFTSLGQRQQKAYHLLSAHPDWVPTVLSAVPVSIRPAVEDNLAAGQQIGSLNGVSHALPHWKIIAPPSANVLLGYYAEASQASGIDWQYLAAINLIETNMGRIQGLSSAGAQGPMQFMPATWASYGRGDVNNPHDAILAAGRYLKVHGAPQNMSRAIYAYNPSNLYVRAVELYARQMFDNSRTFLAYYNWQVFVPMPDGDRWLPEGFSN